MQIYLAGSCMKLTSCKKSRGQIPYVKKMLLKMKITRNKHRTCLLSQKSTITNRPLTELINSMLYT